jgi:hypothetical protein
MKESKKNFLRELATLLLLKFNRKTANFWDKMKTRE